MYIISTNHRQDGDSKSSLRIALAESIIICSLDRFMIDVLHDLLLMPSNSLFIIVLKVKGLSLGSSKSLYFLE
jgi:hypothetical protein